MSILAYGLVALAIMSSIGYGVSRVKTWGADEVRAEWAAANLKAKSEAEARIAKAADDLQAERKKRRVVIQERTVYVDREIEKLVDSGTCFKPLGVCELNRAIGGESKDGCKPDGAVPAVKPAQ